VPKELLMRRAALALLLALALGSDATAAPQPDKPDRPAASSPPVAGKPAAAAADKEAPPPVAKRCKLASGGVRVLTFRQKTCRRSNSCACADACPACP
jgi:hypothetical protein